MSIVYPGLVRWGGSLDLHMGRGLWVADSCTEEVATWPGYVRLLVGVQRKNLSMSKRLMYDEVSGNCESSWADESVDKPHHLCLCMVC